MWSLEHPVGYLMHLPLSKKELKIGRNSNSTLCIAADRSISKHHAKIIVYPNNKIENNNFEINNNRNSICEIIDYGSKYHTYIMRNTQIKLEPGKSYQLEPGDKIKFGMGDNIWTLKYHEIGLLACGYCNDSKINIVRAIESIGGTVYNECNQKCTHFMTLCNRVTSKFVFALSSGLPITDISYWQAFMCAVKNDVKLPNPLDYTVANDTFKIEFKDVAFYPVNERKNLFDGLNFIFFNVQQCNNYGFIIKAAGGRPHIYHKSSFDASELVEPDIIIVECTEAKRNTGIELISDREYDEMELFLSKSKKRMINCKEIISAILFCSINKYCNPLIKSLNKYWRESPKKKLNKVREKNNINNDNVRVDNDGNLNRRCNLNNYAGENDSNDSVVICDKRENESNYSKQIVNSNNNREPKPRNLIDENPWIDTKSRKNSEKSQLSLVKSNSKVIDRKEEKESEAGVSKICEQVNNNVPKIRDGCDKSSTKSLEDKQNEEKKVNNKRKLDKREVHESSDKDNKRFNSGKNKSDDDILVVDDLRDKNQHSDKNNLKNATDSEISRVTNDRTTAQNDEINIEEAGTSKAEEEIVVDNSSHSIASGQFKSFLTKTGGIKSSIEKSNKKVQSCKNKSHDLWDDENEHSDKSNLKNTNQSKDPETSRVINDRTSAQNEVNIEEVGTSKSDEEIVVDNSSRSIASGQFKRFLIKTGGIKSSIEKSNEKVHSCKNKSHGLWDDENEHSDKSNLKNTNQSKDPEISRVINDRTSAQNDEVNIEEAGTSKADEEMVVDNSSRSIASGQFKRFLIKTGGIKSSIEKSNEKVHSYKNKSHGLWDDENEHSEKSNLKNTNQPKDPAKSRVTNDRTTAQNEVNIEEVGTSKADEEMVVDNSFESITSGEFKSFVDETSGVKSPKEQRYNLRSKKDVDETNCSPVSANSQSVNLNEITSNKIQRTDPEAGKVNQKLTDSDRESNLDENGFVTFTIDDYSDEDIKRNGRVDLSQPSSSDSPDYHVYVTTQADVHLVPNTSSGREDSYSPLLDSQIDDDVNVAENNIKPNFHRSNDNNLPKFFFK
ncbi:probable serine/threonine-protein kinase DDB_G0282963 isoform X1 [Microplitis demolitor]|uniref:probable serine/threonine-protein kinase DDB_G0282963 isoform X1 n=1 Tax=Microplitis demolitor TaxID=69319 RepID=UPI00235B61F8|nr:probable serine/threonine-protein kinase DDB_G0282963 isoform X1 [Microplitis demolitor]